MEVSVAMSGPGLCMFHRGICAVGSGVLQGVTRVTSSREVHAVEVSTTKG